MEYKAYTDKGTRDHNEDDCGISSYGDAHCLVVADGLGGHGGGDVASKCAVDAVCTLFMERGFSDHFFADAFSGAQNAILEQQALTQRFSTMKTTLVVLVVDNGWIHWAHIGDSRLYIGASACCGGRWTTASLRCWPRPERSGRRTSAIIPTGTA